MLVSNQSSNRFLAPYFWIQYGFVGWSTNWKSGGQGFICDSHRPPVSPWVSDFTSLYFPFPICTAEILLVLQGLCKVSVLRFLDGKHCKNWIKLLTSFKCGGSLYMWWYFHIACFSFFFRKWEVSHSFITIWAKNLLLEYVMIPTELEQPTTFCIKVMMLLSSKLYIVFFFFC